MFMHIRIIRARAYRIDARAVVQRTKLNTKKLTATGLKLEYDRALALGFVIFVVMAIW